MKKSSFLAFDIGASSGRALRGILEGKELKLEEVLRFPNGMISREGRLHWDAPGIFGSIKQGIAAAMAQGERPESIGLDTWGVDFGLVDGSGELVSLPFAYRDERNAGAMQACFSLIPRERIYELSGIQFLQFNSLFQLYALKIHNPDFLDSARRLLFMPDLFNFWLTGEMATEFTFATTSQLLNPRTKDWEKEYFQTLGLSPSLMNPISFAGTKLGALKAGLMREAGVSGSLPVMLTASHDTAAAVAAVPASGDDWAFISSGTWSIMGIERTNPIIKISSLERNFTNEGGWDGSFRFSKNISGLWLLQECRRIWAERERGPVSFQALTESAEKATPFRSLVDPDDSIFLKPKDMPEAIRSFCRATDQPLPGNRGEVTRCILESLALKYRYVLEELRQVQDGLDLSRIHVIGGGVKNGLLCRFTAGASGLPVHAGPVEATAVGNLMIQALALGAVGSVEEMKRVIVQSFKPRIYHPQNTDEWNKAFERFSRFCVGRAGEKRDHDTSE